MATKRDIDRIHGTWDQDPESLAFWANPPAERLQNIKLSWHQVVGVHSATVSMVKRQAFFLFDSVGIGKTAQSAAMTLMRPWLLSYQQTHNSLPPALGEFGSLFPLLKNPIQALQYDAKKCIDGQGNLRPKNLEGTLFAQPIGTLIFDEAHTLRNFNKLAKATKALAAKAEFSMWLTATPIVTRPEVRNG
ncbi:hypothetical protein BDY19DRAFT_885562 [Irpex rosettiformis]|uniref:Uncharacterized protein n=1 Tax=Irpex rosettiformis TaxID=378272 RepID=A0ACB8UBT6_9APHY|nr:hypothetical protein BDY19DRAFT_885562 [Irpex rosettiformis]